MTSVCSHNSRDFSGAKRKFVIEKVILSLTIFGKESFVRFLVVRGFRQELLLGRDWVIKNAVQLDFQTS